MKRIRVTVTADNIDKGDSYPEECPLALALNAAGFDGAYVRRTYWRPSKTDERELPLPLSAQRFVRQFDEWSDSDLWADEYGGDTTARPKRPKPATFLLPVPE